MLCVSLVRSFDRSGPLVVDFRVQSTFWCIKRTMRTAIGDFRGRYKGLKCCNDARGKKRTDREGRRRRERVHLGRRGPVSESANRGPKERAPFNFRVRETGLGALRPWA